MDLAARVQKELASEEKCLKCTTGVLIKDNNKVDCLLSLVSRDSDTGLSAEGVPDFKWLEKYQQNIGRKSFLNTDGWPWIHLDEAGSSGSEVVAESKLDDAGLDMFGIPGFSPAPTLHPSVSAFSLSGLDETD